MKKSLLMGVPLFYLFAALVKNTLVADRNVRRDQEAACPSTECVSLSCFKVTRKVAVIYLTLNHAIIPHNVRLVNRFPFRSFSVVMNRFHRGTCLFLG